MKNKIYAIIGGTGLYDIPGLQSVKNHQLETPYGHPSASIIEGSLQGQQVFFLSRHGNPHRIPPHCVNYRANLWALRSLGVNQIIAVNAVGGITQAMDAGVFCVPHDIVDYTWGREHTFSDSADVELQHIDLSEPYDSELRQAIITAANAIDGINLQKQGVYAATQGPRLETPAEIIRLERDGCDLVGMTGMPEAALARELEIPYASICLVVNKAAGKSEQEITMEAIEAVMHEGMQSMLQLLQRLIVS